MYFFNINLNLAENWVKKIILNIDNFFNKNCDLAEIRVNKTNLYVDIDDIDNNLFFIYANKKTFNFVKK